MASNPLPTGSSHNNISKNSAINGDIVTQTDIRIDGEIIGNIHCEGKIIIGATGIITGDIFCNNAEILGTLTGNAKIGKLLFLGHTCKIDGNVEAETISIEPLATLNGYCKIVRR